VDRRDVKALSDDELRERGFNEIDIGLFRSGHSSRIDIWIEGMNDPLLSSVPRRTEMKLEDIDPEKQAAGEYCRKGSPSCFCLVGWPYKGRTTLQGGLR